ncbi:MAG: 3-hydroxyacyl-CoA dehydrogenase NAD-binding domain-containing protein [Bacteroidia bacterium]|nr:3-hydroxyacyl-CoA dehydrogenase NAD-binding domain-containing protein [Bacteroidia bacterium]MDW8235109.1 3-hydroxyacyl-CoA dehydrogenase NAD-binding domain-containing protein [Bacteroidia bacterium]
MIEVSREGSYALLIWRMPRVNVLSPESVTAFQEALESVLTDSQVRGIVITSANPEFLAGADIRYVQQLVERQSIEEIYQNSWRVQEVFLRVETGGKPVVAAIGGSALGGGYELALACHHRIAWNASDIEIGLPETTLGLMPGAGGTQRLPRKIGVAPALQLILEGRRLRPAEAHAYGLVEELVGQREDLIPRALQWLSQTSSFLGNPWNAPDYRIEQGHPQSEEGRRIFTAAIAKLRERTYGNYPGLEYALRAVYEGLQVPFVEGLRIESSYFARTLATREARAMVRTLFIERQRLLSLPHRPAQVPPASFQKVVILGAGMMGSAIAYVCAQAGYATWVKDTSPQALEKARNFSENLLQREVQRGRLSPQKAQGIQQRLSYTTEYQPLAGADLVIEAVFEDRAVKTQVYAEILPYLSPQGVLASNTSTLPITSLAEAAGVPDRFIGLHFFSPAERMPLLEIILGKHTSQQTLAWALDFSVKIGKVPVVVRDSRGFFTSRVFGTYVREGLRMLMEGVPPALIENLGRQAGMPVGPLALADEVSLSLMYSILRQTERDLGVSLAEDPVASVGELFVEKLGRSGRKAGKGFYEYPPEGKKYLWSELNRYFPSRPIDPALYPELRDRFLYVQVAEALRALKEGILLDARDGDVASILGWGFPPFTGGVFSMIEWVGEEQFRMRMNYLKMRYGDRFDAS